RFGVREVDHGASQRTRQPVLSAQTIVDGSLERPPDPLEIRYGQIRGARLFDTNGAWKRVGDTAIAAEPVLPARRALRGRRRSGRHRRTCPLLRIKIRLDSCRERIR